MSEWISVKDRLPEPWNPVLIAQCDTGAVLTAYYSELDGWESTNGLLVEASHWMPMPPPPQENSNDE